MVGAGTPDLGREYLEAVDGLRRLGRRIVAFWHQHDVLLTPTVTHPPPTIGSLDATGTSRWIPFLTYWNSTGQPAMSLPLHHVDGLPVGVQLVGPPAGDELLLRLATQFGGGGALGPSTSPSCCRVTRLPSTSSGRASPSCNSPLSVGRCYQAPPCVPLQEVCSPPTSCHCPDQIVC